MSNLADGARYEHVAHVERHRSAMAAEHRQMEPLMESKVLALRPLEGVEDESRCVDPEDDQVELCGRHPRAADETDEIAE